MKRQNTTDSSYLTALSRKSLSPTGSCLLQHQLLLEGETYLDYGCGYGYDVEWWKARGYDASGYDPHYRPEPPQPADVVTLCHVLNVIENPEARSQTLRKAWDLTRKRSIVCCKNGSRIRDQPRYFKEYTSVELRAYIEVVLGREAIALKSDTFLVDRDRSRHYHPLPRPEVERAIASYASQGFVAPRGAFIKGYCKHFRFPGGQVDTPNFGLWPADRFFRLACSRPLLPGPSGQLVKHIHLGKTRDTERYRWAEAAILRRNRIWELKFHCQDFSYLDEFRQWRDWTFLDPDWRPNPDALGQPDTSRKDKRRANPKPAKIARDE